MATLGIDFLRVYKLSVDPAAGKLVQDGTGLTFSPPSPFSVGRQLRLMCPQLFLVLLARQPLQHQLFPVLMAGGLFFPIFLPLPNMMGFSGLLDAIFFLRLI
jgi:hypothetical protein